MGLGQVVKDAYSKAASFVKKEETFINASVLASLCCLTDAATTKTGMVFQPSLNFPGCEKICYYFLNNYGLNGGLALESLISISIAAPLAFTLNKILRKESKQEERIKHKHGIRKLKENIRAFPNNFNVELGTSYFYALSIYSLYAAFNNVYMYYMMEGIITGKSKLPF